MGDDVMASALEMATSSFMKFGNMFKSSTEPADKIRNVTQSSTNTFEYPTALTSSFFMLKDALTEKGKRLSNGLNRALSAENSPTTVFQNLGRLTPLLRRSETCKKQPSDNQKINDFYVGQSKRASISSRVGLKELENASMKRTFTDRNEDGMDGGVISQGPSYDHVTDRSARTETHWKERNMTGNGSSGFNEIATDKRVVKKRMRQQDPTHDFDRQDSGFYSAGRGSELCISAKQNVSEEDSDEEDTVENDGKGKAIDPFQMISDIVSMEQRRKQSFRDPYRVIRRPSQMKRNTISRSLSMRDNKCLERFDEGTDTDKNDNTFNKEPKVKLSVQTFTSSKQIRVVVTEISNIADLSQKNCKSEQVDLQLCLRMGNLCHKERRKIKLSDKRCQEMFYFLDVDVDNLSNSELRIHFKEKQRYWPQKKTIGKVSIPLENFDFTFETKMWCMVLDPKQHKLPKEKFQIVTF